MEQDGDARDRAIATGDWIAAAMQLVLIQPATVRFRDRTFAYSRNANGCLRQLDPAIKLAAVDFGLHPDQAERFYARVTKRVALPQP